MGVLMTQIKKETDELFSSRTNNLLAQIQSTVRYHVADQSCSWCDKTVRIDEFKDQLSKDEFKISALCQTCQDLTFREVE